MVELGLQAQGASILKLEDQAGSGTLPGQVQFDPHKGSNLVWPTYASAEDPA